MTETGDRSSVDQHNDEIEQNRLAWERKPLLRRVYRGLHEAVARELPESPAGLLVELGSGIGNIRDVIPGCLRTDLFPNPWLDQVENAYGLSFADASVAALILFDVFHHLRYPGTALAEFRRVLVPGGHVIVVEPCLSVLGSLVYGPLHAEPLGTRNPVEWLAPPGWSAQDVDYYAAQGNATRIFLRGEFDRELDDWQVLRVRRLSGISYVASGGYSGPQLYPACAYPLMRALDRVCDSLPGLFATRLLAVLQRR